MASSAAPPFVIATFPMFGTAARALGVSLLCAATTLLFACSSPAPLSGSRGSTASHPPIVVYDARNRPPEITGLREPVPDSGLRLDSEPVRVAPAFPPAPVPQGMPLAPEAVPPASPGLAVPLPALPPASGSPGLPPASTLVPPSPAEPVARLGTPSRPADTTIALVLPLESASYGRAAQAVRDGFMAAARAARREATVRIFAHADDGVLPAVSAAAQQNAALIVGPLLRDDVKSVLALDTSGRRFLLLNHPDDGSRIPENVYGLSLAIESDAIQLAHAAHADGLRVLAAVTNESPLQRRFHDAFAAAWAQDAHEALRDYRFNPAPDVLQVLRRELSTRGVDGVLLAVDGNDAALTKSFLPVVAVYASSQIVDDQASLTPQDLNNIRYVEVPWLARPEDPAFAGLDRPAFPSRALARLYALGIDAFAIARILVAGDAPERIELEGASGHLALLPSRLFMREGQVMVIRDGIAVPYSPSR